MSYADHAGYKSRLKDVVKTIRAGGKPVAYDLSCGHRLWLHGSGLRLGPMRRKCPVCNPETFVRKPC